MEPTLHPVRGEWKPTWSWWECSGSWPRAPWSSSPTSAWLWRWRRSWPTPWSWQPAPLSTTQIGDHHPWPGGWICPTVTALSRKRARVRRLQMTTQTQKHLESTKSAFLPRSQLGEPWTGRASLFTAPDHIMTGEPHTTVFLSLFPELWIHGSFPFPWICWNRIAIDICDEAQIAALYHMRTSELHLGNLQSVFLAYNSMHVNLFTVDWLIW